MPIVTNNGDIHIEYTIPEEIDSKIPSYFYIAFAGELCSILGPVIFTKYKMDPDDENNKEYYYDLDCGTCSWYAALKATCNKLDMNWLIDYYGTLEWYDSDIFDGIIEERIVKNFIEHNNHCNDYYKHLTNCFDIL